MPKAWNCQSYSINFYFKLVVLPWIIFVLCPHACQEACQEAWQSPLAGSGRKVVSLSSFVTKLYHLLTPPPPSASQEALFVIKAMYVWQVQYVAFNCIDKPNKIVKGYWKLDWRWHFIIWMINSYKVGWSLHSNIECWNQWSVCHWNWLYSSDFSFLS